MTGSSAAAASGIPDRLAFVSDALAFEGALIEAGAESALAVLPESLARELQLPDVARLISASGSAADSGAAGAVGRGAGGPADDAVSIDFGSRLLEQLVERSQRSPVAATVRQDADPPRLSQARALAERWVVRNGVHQVEEIHAGRAVYSSAWIAWTAESDERNEGLVQVVLSEHAAAEPEPSFAERLDPTRSDRLAQAQFEPPAPAGAADLALRLAARAGARVTAALAPLVDAAARRQRRDHERLCVYFAELAREAVVGARKRRIDPATLADKLRHFEAERDAKLAELRERFRLRVSTAPLAALRVEVPTVFVRMRLRRRKGERELVLSLPAGAGALDRPRCEGCAGSAASVALCDDQLHVLCAECAPSAQGRIRCPACGTGAKR